MALIKCKECEKKYSDKAEACPECGCPTITNTTSEKRKNLAPCSVKIKGNEKYYPPIALRALGVAISYIIISVLIQIYIFEPAGAKEAGIIFLIIGVVLVGLSLWIAKKLPGYKKDIKHRNIINEYFQNRFSILNDLPSNCSQTKVISVRSLEDNNDLMFRVYMEAYKFDADAIVIHDSNVVMKNVQVGKNINSAYNIRDINVTVVRF